MVSHIRLTTSMGLSLVPRLLYGQSNEVGQREVVVLTGESLDPLDLPASSCGVSLVHYVQSLLLVLLSYLGNNGWIGGWRGLGINKEVKSNA